MEGSNADLRVRSALYQLDRAIASSRTFCRCSLQHSRTPSTPTAGHAAICAHGQGTAAQGSRAFSAAVPSPEFPLTCIHTHTHNLQRLPQQPETTSWPISSNSSGCPGAELEADLHENGSECDVAKNGSRECATRVVKGVRDPCRGGVPGEGVQLGVCGLWVGV